VTTVLAGMLAVALSAWFSFNATGAAIVFVIILLLGMCLARPAVAGHLALITACAAMPAFVPSSIAFGGFTIFAYEPFLVVAFIRAISHFQQGEFWIGRHAKRGLILFAVFVGLLIFAAVVGLASGHEPGKVLADIRHVPAMGMAMIVGASLIPKGEGKSYSRTIGAILWFSLLMVAASSVFGLELNGRSESAQLYSTAGGMLTNSSAIRYLTSATFLALAVVMFCASMAILKISPLKRLWPYFVPAILLLFLGFSRNHLLGIAVAILVSVIIGFLARRGVRTVAGALGAFIGIGMILTVLAFAISSTPAGSRWVETQLDAYSSRVLQGLGDQALAVDTSSQDRVVENSLMIDAISSDGHFLVGSGMGYAYKPAMGQADGFAADGGRYYGHNYYLWILMKAGIVGLLSVAGLFTYSIVVGIRAAEPRRDLAWPAAAVVAGFAAVMLFAPMPNGTPTALILGLALALTWSSVAPLGLQTTRENLKKRLNV
jgi:hypothetical protein